MRLVLYSGGHFDDNPELDEELLGLARKKNPSIVYIPSTCGFGEDDFRSFVAHFKKYKFSEFSYFPVDCAFTAAAAEKVMTRDIIYLSGGNTFHFLHHFKKTIIFSKMKTFLSRGGVLAGQSAGSIMMTPSIQTASFPSFDHDKNEVGLKDFKSLGLVSFEFFPHFTGTPRYSKEIQNYSATSRFPVIACPDGSGVVVNEKKTTFVGNCTFFTDGKKCKI